VRGRLSARKGKSKTGGKNRGRTHETKRESPYQAIQALEKEFPKARGGCGSSAGRRNKGGKNK